MIKLTKKEYRELDLFISDNCNHSDYSWRLQQARQKGWIEKTALEELQEYYNNNFNDPMMYNWKLFAEKLYNLALKAIKEIKGDK